MLGNVKTNGFDSLQKIYLFCSRGNDILSREIVLAYLPSHRGLCCKKKISPLREQILTFSNYLSIQL